MFEGLRKSLSRLVWMRPYKPRLPRKKGRAAPIDSRMYQAARQSRLTSGWATSTTSADSELISSLHNLRNRCRALIRDSAYAKRAKVIVQNNVVGSGIGMQAQVMTTRDELNERVNDAIEEAWEDWCSADSCHTGGTLHFSDFERTCMGQIFEAGEIFIRKYSRVFGNSEIPFALELIEPERIADEFQFPVPPGVLSPDAMMKLGIEVDRFGRPLAYWIRQMHPGELRFIPGVSDKLERVPADQIMHLRLVDRWPQTRGEPWLHAVARKLNDMDGYSEAEIIAARAAATVVFTIETPNDDSPAAGIATDSSSVERELTVEPGMGKRLAPGETFKTSAPNRPNTALDPFMRYMIREFAAGAGVSYESVSRDYSQSNYSSSRLALLDDRDLWKMLQQWFIRSFRCPIHEQWLQAAVLSGAIPEVSVAQYALEPEKFEAVAFKPRGWGWIDPTKEVEAYKSAVKAGFTTVSDVIAATGGGQDLEDVARQRQRELKMFEQMQLEFDTNPSVYVAAETGSQKGTGTPPASTEGEPGGPQGGQAPPGQPPGQAPASTQNPPKQRVLSFTRAEK